MSYTYSIQSGALPSGLAIDGTTGEISGTLTTAESGTFIVRVTDSDGRTADTVTINYDVDAVFSMADPTGVDGITGAVISSTDGVASGGETPYSYAVQTGSLPTGLSLNASTGEISGTLGAVGTGSFVIRATDTDSRTADSSTINWAITGALAIVDPTVPAVLTVNEVVSWTDGVASGGTSPYTYTVQTGALPSGTTLNASTGEISGTLTTAETGSFVIRVTDNVSNTADTGTINFDVDAVLTMADPTIPGTFDNGDVISITDGVASGGETAYTYTVQSGALPSGLSLNASTGEISGTLTTVETGSFVIRVTDSESRTADSSTINFTVAAAGATASTAGKQVVEFAGSFAGQNVNFAAADIDVGDLIFSIVLADSPNIIIMDNPADFDGSTVGTGNGNLRFHYVYKVADATDASSGITAEWNGNSGAAHIAFSAVIKKGSAFTGIDNALSEDTSLTAPSVTTTGESVVVVWAAHNDDGLAAIAGFSNGFSLESAEEFHFQAGPPPGTDVSAAWGIKLVDTAASGTAAASGGSTATEEVAGTVSFV